MLILILAVTRTSHDILMIGAVPSLVGPPSTPSVAHTPTRRPSPPAARAEAVLLEAVLLEELTGAPHLPQPLPPLFVDDDFDFVDRRRVLDDREADLQRQEVLMHQLDRDLRGERRAREISLEMRQETQDIRQVTQDMRQEAQDERERKHWLDVTLPPAPPPHLGRPLNVPVCPKWVCDRCGVD